MADTSCNALWQCATACTMTLDGCIQGNSAGVSTWGPSVALCANQHCAQNGCPY
jgi:hypothetical protein